MRDQERTKLSLQTKMDKISQEIFEIQELADKLQQEKQENNISEEEHEELTRIKIMHLQEEISRLEFSQYILSKIRAAVDDKITELNLSGSKLSKVPIEVWKLSHLHTLDLSRNNLKSLPKEIGKLVNLENLLLNENSLDELPVEIGKLIRLKTLDLLANNLKAIPPQLCLLKSLESLDLSYNTEITDLPVEFKNLTNLRHLIISDNYFREDYVNNFLLTVTNFKRLKTLAITNIGITSIPQQFSELKELEDLDLHYNNISDLPIDMSRLTTLRNIDLNGNDFDEIPECIYELRNLESLYMSENHIKKIDSRISNLNQLKILSFGTTGKGLMIEASDFDASNQISELPTTLLQLTNLEVLDLTGNPLSIPIEILEKINDPSAIVASYFGKSQQTTYESLKEIDKAIFVSVSRQSLLQSKLLIVGQGSVGKTSLVLQILHGIFDQNQTKTEGISINQWAVDSQSKIGNQNSEIKLNLWDFGGQEIMHATHQFFLTKRSLYLLVLDSRLTQEENRLEYWLKIIQSFGGESPVLIVGNKVDQHPLDIDRTGLQKKYPNIVGILETSAATGAGIEELKAAIAEQVNNLPHVRDLLPETWFTVKTKLEELGRQSNFITHDKYLELCAANEVSDETSQRTLIGFLHDLGVVLHFQDDPRLEALGILNPQWVTNGVYKILNSHELFQNKGILTLSMLNSILNIDGYPRDKRLFIVDMMKKFELCYDIEADKTFLVPDLLPKDEPAELKFNGVPAFEYAYPVLPSSVITRFIVRMNQHIYDNCVWRTGVLLKIGENKALVKADIEDRKITIGIDGLEHTRRDALSAIRYQLDEIHNSIKGLNPQKMVPIPDAPNAEPIEYDYLLMLEREGQETHPVKDGSRLVKVNVREILSAIENESQRKEIGGNLTNIYISGNVEGSNIISGDNNVVTQNIRDSFNKADSADIQAELKETLKQLAAAVDAMSKTLPAEQATEAAEDLGKLVEEATKPKPNKKWYSVSIEGLIKAAENLDKLGEPVINLSRKVLSLLTGGTIR